MVRDFYFDHMTGETENSAPGSRIAGMEIQVFQKENSSQTKAYSHYSNYSYSGLIPNKGALNWITLNQEF